MEDKDFFDTETPQNNNTPEEGVEIKVKEKVRLSLEQAAQEAEEGRDIVAEYETRYHGKQEKSDRGIKIPPRYKRGVRPAPAQVSDDEKLWAAIAHASSLLTIGMLVVSAGLGSLLTLFIPLAIYLVYRHKSEFVAYHALQAFVAQAVGSIGVMVLLTAGTIVFIVLTLISLVLMLVVVGFVLLPIVVILGLVALGAILLLPLVILVLSMIAAVEAWDGRYYKYPWIGDWVDTNMYEL